MKVTHMIANYKDIVVMMIITNIAQYYFKRLLQYVAKSFNIIIYIFEFNRSLPINLIEEQQSIIHALLTHE